MRLVYLGDIVGRAGREAVLERVAEIRRRIGADFLIVNGENAAGGFGITGKICHELYAAGVDVVTTGNHVWDQRELLDYIDSDERLLRPINFPPGTPGRGATVVEGAGGHRVLVINVMGRIFMDPLDDPFAAVNEQLDICRLGESVDAAVVDIHAEATSEKMAMGHFCDGRATLVVGSHSHVPTADLHILGGGTAYMTDAGMCGPYDSVIGMEKTEPINRFTRKISSGRFAPAMGEATICGLAVETDPRTGLALRAGPIRLGGLLAETFPDWATEQVAAE